MSGNNPGKVISTDKVYREEKSSEYKHPFEGKPGSVCPICRKQSTLPEYFEHVVYRHSWFLGIEFLNKYKQKKREKFNLGDKPAAAEKIGVYKRFLASDDVREGKITLGELLMQKKKN